MSVGVFCAVEEGNLGKDEEDPKEKGCVVRPALKTLTEIFSLGR